jgi:hypothetical protein
MRADDNQRDSAFQASEKTFPIPVRNAIRKTAAKTEFSPAYINIAGAI